MKNRKVKLIGLGVIFGICLSVIQQMKRVIKKGKQY